MIKVVMRWKTFQKQTLLVWLKDQAATSLPWRARLSNLESRGTHLRGVLGNQEQQAKIISQELSVWVGGPWRTGLSKVQGSNEKRAKRIDNTLNEHHRQLTQQFAKNGNGVSSFAGGQVAVARVSGGFTIVELMIASAVFSIILLVALAGFTAIGRVFYKGVTINQTQDVADQVLTDVSQNIQSAASVSGLQTGNGYQYYCIGGVRYTINLKHELDTTQAEDYSVGGNFALVRDKLPGATGCAAPCPTASGCPAGTLPFNEPVEMLGNHMRLMKLDIASANGQLYNVNVVIAFGSDDSFTNVSDPDQIACIEGAGNQSFCSVNRLSAGVYEGLHS